MLADAEANAKAREARRAKLKEEEAAKTQQEEERNKLGGKKAQNSER